MQSRIFRWFSRYNYRLAWPGFALVMLLQRTPIPRVFAELTFSMGPRMVHALKWVVGTAITSFAYNTVTGATGDLSITPNTNDAGRIVTVAGDQLNLAVRAERAVPETVSFVGELPEGMVSNLGPQGQVPNGVIAFSGVPADSGIFPINLSILTWESASTYEGDPVQINFAILVTDEPPEISSQPVSQVIPWGSTAEMSVETSNPEGVTYQWQRNVGASLNEFADIQGATETTYSVPNATPALDGAYRVVVTKNNLAETSNTVFLTVQVSDYSAWRNKEFENPQSEDAAELSNPDGDAFINAFEFYFDFNPERPDTVQSPMIGYEEISGVSYAVFTFPPVVGGPSLSFNFESANDFDNGPWVELVNGVDGVIIENSVAASILKIPYANSVYCRMRVDTGE